MSSNIEAIKQQNLNGFFIFDSSYIQLNNLIQYAYANSRYYKSKYDSIFSGCPLVKSKEDLSKIPFTDGKLIEGKNSYNFLSTQEEDISYIFFSGGTSGSPKAFFYNLCDWEEIVRYRAMCYEFSGVNSDDIVQIMVPYGIWSVGQSAQDAFRKLNLTIIPTGCWKKAIFESFSIMKNLKTTILMTTPSMALIIGQELIKNGIEIKENHIRKIITTGENVPKSLRMKIEEMWGAELTAMFASSEAVLGIECQMHDGYHVLDDNILIEIIDKNGNPVKDGEIGELVITPLYRKAMPLIRYKMGDLVQLINNCECGCGFPKFRFICRKNNNFVLSTGVNISEYQIQKSLDSLSFNVFRYQVILRDDQYGNETISFYLETDINSKTETNYNEAMRVLSSISIDFLDVISEGWIDIELKFLKIGTLSATDYTSKQKKKFIDLRKYPK